MAKKTFTVTVEPTETKIYTIEASNRKAATNRAYRQWRDEVAKNHDAITVERSKDNQTELPIETETESED